MSTPASPPAHPSTPQDEDGFSRRNLLTATAVVAAAGSALALPGRASAAPADRPLAAPNRRPASNKAQVTWSSESTASGYAPKSATWFADPEVGLAGVSYKLSRRNDIALTSAGRDFGTVITVDPARTYQKMLGIGSSMEDSTVHNLSLMGSGVRTKVLRALFDPSKGAGFNLTRICFGASDFSHGDFYTYDDGPADPTLSRFSIQKDIDNHIISTLKEALRINPDLVCGTAWSAPAWMKDNNSLIDGHLLDKYIPTLAVYYRKIVQAYAKQGIPLHAVTPQNEPMWPAGIYPSMLVSPQQEQKLIDAMRKEFDAHGIKTEIWGYDYNFGDADNYLPGLYGNAKSGYTDAYRNSTAIAFHDYSGDPSRMSLAKADYPDLDMIMTERMWWGTSGADRIARYMRSSSTGYLAWVTMLDQNRDAQHLGSPDPTPLLQNPDDRDTWWSLPEYYLFAQFSKFVQRGAKRIWSDYGSTDTITTVAFLNPDDTITTVVINASSSAQEFTLRSGKQQVIDNLPPKTVGTYVWRSSASSAAAVDACGTLQAETYSSAAGVGIEATGDTTGGEDIAYLGNGDWVAYDKVAFGAKAATQFKARVASGAADGVKGRIEVRIDSRTSKPVGSIEVSNTGGWQTWTTKLAGISGVTGTHTVYLTFTSEGKDDFANLNWFTFTQNTGTDAYGPVQAENYLNASGLVIENTGDTGGGKDVAYISPGDWAEYPDVVFGDKAATRFKARVASGAGSGVKGRIEVRIDSRTSDPVGSIEVTNTGGWQTWSTKSADISDVTGTHTVYLTFTSDGKDDFTNINWFTFDH
ncbi:carbohydrate-binding protein [Streptomyces turgidiscabies]|uniref:Tat pathway signal sequence domain protein n=1 Tax=Streptomyces turgidiscabies (strain Car8) TaxID=698760 RepID=L7ETR0_STRT8|nr:MULTISPECIES: carbohydrate-binding protein [Streptomyces]ELP62803.1 Tat pathway signal sequence domain protein [Streptomyces turgidiscabies Car8]MDX3498986.1 carbohydrate-binding protein [Streptomyces turgidiscabies]GAQ73434.1 endo-1,4-beta-xylanase A precursor [Streptomyces turgidiscabies]